VKRGLIRTIDRRKDKGKVATASSRGRKGDQRNEMQKEEEERAKSPAVHGNLRRKNRREIRNAAKRGELYMF